MEHTANIINPNNGLIPSLVDLFSMFDFRLFHDIDKVKAISIRCINCKKETGLYLGTSTLEEIINKFVVNAILYHVGMFWIFCSNEEMKYEIDKSDHQDWLNKVTWYNTGICSRLHGSLFEYFITHTRTDRYNLVCSLVSHAKKEPAYEDEGSIIGDRIIPKHVTTEALEALGVTLDFIEIWLKLLDGNYEIRCGMYNKDMKEIFKQIPTTMTKPLSQKQKFQKLMT